jgi:hypothetical protein
MPKSKRDLLRRQVAHAHNNLMLACEHIAAVGVEFEGVHPELEQGLIIAADLSNQADLVLKAFVMAAWGKDDPSWDSWRNLSTKDPTLKYISDDSE